MARVSQLPLAETRKLLTNQRILVFLDTSCQQLVRRRLLLRDLQRSGMNGHCGADCDIPASGLPPRQGMRVQPSGRFPSL